MQLDQAQTRLLERFTTLEGVERHIKDLEELVKKHQDIQSQLHNDYKKKINNLERVYRYFPFKKGYKLNTRRDNLVDLFTRFHSAVFELEPEKLEDFIDQMIKEYSTGEEA